MVVTQIAWNEFLKELKIQIILVQQFLKTGMPIYNRHANISIILFQGALMFPINDPMGM